MSAPCPGCGCEDVVQRYRDPFPMPVIVDDAGANPPKTTERLETFYVCRKCGRERDLMHPAAAGPVELHPTEK